MSNLEKFLTSYGQFVSDNASVNLDIDKVLEDVSTNIINPNTTNSEINKLYERGVALKK